MSDDVGDTLVANRDLADLEELVGSLLSGNTVDRETALDVVKETEVLARLLNRDDIWRPEVHALFTTTRKARGEKTHP